MVARPNDTWERNSRQWSAVGQPLRPGAEDIAFTEHALAEFLDTERRPGPAGLVLGVTPELCRVPMCSDSRIVAVDKSAEMIRRVWRPRPGMHDDAICADWRAMPLAPSSLDLAMGDGSLSTLRYPDEYATVLGELGRVLRGGSRCVIRCFMQVDSHETTDEVFADLSRGRIGNFHVLKWRLMMALQPDAVDGVGVASVLDAVTHVWPDLNHLAARFAWPIEQVLTINAYRDVDTRYTFPTRTQYGECFTGAGWSVIDVATPLYELGERCPTFVLAPAADRGRQA